jgi:2,3-bisphosphoglycerate-independent phosphoglycerate mutase
MTAPVKYIVLLTDGAADLPLERMAGLTPLAVARKPRIDALATAGRGGTLDTVPSHMTPDSAVANLSVLGYDAASAYQGRGVLEAASLGVELGPDDVAMRLNLIGIEDDCIADHSSGHISSAEAFELLDALRDELARDGVEFFPGNSFRHLCVLRGARFDPRVDDWPPHDHVGKPVRDARITARVPEAEYTAAVLNRITTASRSVLAEHPVNKARIARNKRPAGAVWFWAAGRKPRMKTLQERYGITGAIISAVDLIHGLGVYAGMTSMTVEGATGLHDTNYEGKAAAAIEALETHDLVYVHVEGPDESGHAKDLGLKIHCLESIDKRLVAKIQAGLEDKDWKVVWAVLPDHLTPVERGDHVGDPVPVIIADPDKPADSVSCYSEAGVQGGALGAMVGPAFMDELLWRVAKG